MAVIINEFEIIDDRSRSTTAPAAPASDEQPRPQARLRPEEIERIVQHFAARRRRVHAD